MRVVQRRVEAAFDPALLPTADDLERVRFLSSHYRGAGLHPVRLVPLDVGASAVAHADSGPPEEHGARTWLALESMQVTGSFKVRGAMHAIARRLELARPDAPAPLVVVAASAGNHGVGIAHAAKYLGVDATVVVPRDAPRTKVDKIRNSGARVVVSSSPGYDAAEREARQLASERSGVFVSPYDDIDVLVGNGASLGFEIVRALGHVPSVVYCPIGGGGLATGLACALRHELGDARGAGEDASPRGMVVPVQSEASCAFAMSLERNRAVVELEPQPTIAEGLEGGISERAFARARAVLDRVVVCEEREIEHALRWAARDLGLLIEGSAAVALAPALSPESLLGTPTSGDTVVVLTGRNIDVERLGRVLSQDGWIGPP